MAYGIIDLVEVDTVNEYLYKPRLTFKEKQSLLAIFQRSKVRLEGNTLEDQNEFILKMRSFVRLYEFLLQATNFEDIDLHKKYNFIVYFLSFVNIKHPGNGFNLDGKISATNFSQKKTGEHKDDPLNPDPFIEPPQAGPGVMNNEKENRLSEIIEDINARTGKKFYTDVTKKSIKLIVDLLMKSKDLEISAKNNTESDFEFKFWEVLDDLLIDNMDKDEEFFTLLLDNEDMKKEIFIEYIDEIYYELKGLD